MQRLVICIAALMVGGANSVAVIQMKVATPEDLDKAMKETSASYGAANKWLSTNPGTLAGGLQGALAGARRQLATARETLMSTRSFWMDKKREDAVGFVDDALAKMTAVDEAIDTTLSENVGTGTTAAGTAGPAAALREVAGACQACHQVYREQDPNTKAYSIKAGMIR